MQQKKEGEEGKQGEIKEEKIRERVLLNKTFFKCTWVKYFIELNMYLDPNVNLSLIQLIKIYILD